MATIKPFKAIRPTRDKVHLVASRSYLSYSKKTLEEKLDNNPYTFLHIINPKSKNKKIKNEEERFIETKKKYQEFIDQKYFIKDRKSAYYIYQQKNKYKTYIGIIAAISVEDYLNGEIKKHEKTITKREKMFEKYLDITCFNADPVLLSYSNKDNLIENIFLNYQKERPEYEFTTTNKTLHKLWIVNDLNHINTITKSFKKIKELYIADGHHRCASSTLLSKKKKNKYFMSLLINEKQLNIINYNRIIKKINNLSTNEFIKKIKKKFNIHKCNYQIPSRQQHIGMYIDKKYYIMQLKEDIIKKNCVNKLAPSILMNNILNPILNILDERKDNNIIFEEGKKSFPEIKKNIDSGLYKVAFILKPISIQAIKEVADNEMYMPPKSTYIEPKLRSGLTIYPIC